MKSCEIVTSFFLKHWQNKVSNLPWKTFINDEIEKECIGICVLTFSTCNKNGGT